MNDSQKIQSIRDTVRRIAPPRSMAILFGSRARGDAHPNSDWDILWILDKETLTELQCNSILRECFH